MRAVRNGDASAYGPLLAEVARILRPRIRQRMGAFSADSEDVLQETLLAIHLKNASWDETRPILPWLYAVAEHKAIDAIRRGQRVSRLVSPSVSPEDLADTVSIPAAEHDLAGLDVERHLAALPDREREVVRACTLDGSSIAAVSKMLGIREGAVRVALHRGLKRIARAAREGTLGARIA